MRCGWDAFVVEGNIAPEKFQTDVFSPFQIPPLRGEFGFFPFQGELRGETLIGKRVERKIGAPENKYALWLSSLTVCDRMTLQSILSREERKCQMENARVACS